MIKAVYHQSPNGSKVKVPESGGVPGSNDRPLDRHQPAVVITAILDKGAHLSFPSHLVEMEPARVHVRARACFPVLPVVPGWPSPGPRLAVASSEMSGVTLAYSSQELEEWTHIKSEPYASFSGLLGDTPPQERAPTASEGIQQRQSAGPCPGVRSSVPSNRRTPPVVEGRSERGATPTPDPVGLRASLLAFRLAARPFSWGLFTS